MRILQVMKMGTGVLKEEGRPMPKKLQIELAKKLLSKRGISPDVVDLEAEIDSSLHFDENMRELSRKVGIPLTKALEERVRDTYIEDDDSHKHEELLREWLVMELGEDEFYEILDEMEEEEELKKEKAKIIREEIDQMIRETDEFIQEEYQSRMRQLIEYWSELEKQGILLEYLSSLIAPHVEGEKYDEIRKAILLVLATSTDFGIHRARIHCLLIGQPGTAKTEFLNWINTYLAPYGLKTEFIDATRMSRVGLTVDARGKEPRPGALIKAHKGLALIDELDKAKKGDLDGLLQAMETGKVKITVGGVDEWFDAEVRVIATANEDNFTAQLIDRFDFVFHLERPTIDERKSTVDKLVDLFFGEMDIGRPAFELSQYLRYIASYHPKATPDVRNTIKKVMKAYIDLRKDSKLTESSYRNFELSIFRIAYAIAKIHRRDVKPIDVVEALKMKDPEIKKNETILATLYAIVRNGLDI